MKTCPFCWRDNDDDALRCCDCGKPLRRVDARPAQGTITTSVATSGLEATPRPEGAKRDLLKKRPLLVLVALAILIAFGLALWARPRDKLVYRGKHLREWVNELHPFGQEPTKKSIVSAAAIQQIGSNAVPFLLGEIKALVGTKGVPPDPRDQRLMEAYGRKARAIVALIILGTNGHSAIPELLDLICTSETHSAASIVLCSFGEKGVSAVANRMADADPHVRLKAAETLGLGERAPEEAISALLTALEDTNARVRIAAIESLEMLEQRLELLGDKHRAELFVMHLLNRFQLDAELEVRITAASALGTLGEKARPAVPALMAVITNYESYQSLRIAASDALRQIDRKRALEAEKQYPSAFRAKQR